MPGPFRGIIERMSSTGVAGPGAHVRSAIRLRVIGVFAVDVAGSPAPFPAGASRKARTVLKLLAVERGHLVPVDRLVDALWPDNPPAQPANNVATLVSRVRAWLGADAVTGGRDGYRLGPLVEVDLDEGARLVARAERSLVSGHPGLALSAAEQACAVLDHGKVLEDEPYASWAEPARVEHVALLRRARLAHVDAAMATGTPGAAAAAAASAVADDALDEEAVRRMMAAYQAAGEPAKALAAYADLRAVLADALGTEPAAETAAAHTALLRDEPVLPGRAAPATPRLVSGEEPDLVERDAEREALRAEWASTTAGRAGVVLVVGEAGIGKTTLAEAMATEVAASGGRVLRTRCYEAERTLFLQPLVDALTPVLAALPPHRLRELAGDHVDALVGLVPDVALALGPGAPALTRAGIARRRAFEAVLHVLRRLSERAPVLLVLDDLHNAGTTTAEAVRYLVRHGSGVRLLVVATLRREEGTTALATLAEVTRLVEPGTLSKTGVTRLAATSGHADQGEAIWASTRGHPFFVSEVLRGIAAGEDALPDSLQTAVLDRVARAGDEVERVLRAASVLGSEVDPATVAALLGRDDEDVMSRCERALSLRLLTVSGRAYEFANDLIREVLYSSTPEPTRVGWHRRAADLAGTNHEAMATHAEAAGEPPRAARAWLLAAEEALERFAATDAEDLAERATAAATTAGTTEVLGRALLVRAKAREAREAYAGALADLEAAAALARESGDLRFEMSVQRWLAGDVPVALGLGTRFCDPHLERGLQLARTLGDRTMEADLLGRRAVIASNRLRLRDAVTDGEAAVAVARAADDAGALVVALDGLKNALSFVGDVAGMQRVVDELEPELRRRGDLWRLQWCVFESAYPAIAAADWTLAESRIEAGAEVGRRSGFLAYAGWYESHLGWLQRLTGRDEEAIATGRHAVAAGDGAAHPWWRSTACMLLAGTLLEVGDRDEAIALLHEGLAAAELDQSEGYVLRCVALLADATGDGAHLERADQMLQDVQAPAGQVWMLGYEAYLAVARAWLAAGDPTRSRTVLAPVLVAARAQHWRPVLAEALLQDALAGRALGDPRAESAARESLALATACGLPRLVARAAAAVADTGQRDVR